MNTRKTVTGITWWRLRRGKIHQSRDGGARSVCGVRLARRADVSQVTPSSLLRGEVDWRKEMCWACGTGLPRAPGAER